MTEQIIKSIINFAVPVLLGYAVASIKGRRSIKNAIKIMLQNNLSNTFYVYDDRKQIPDYIYKNWLSMLKEYENLGGDDYIHTLADKMKLWDIVRTDILNN